MIFFWIFGSIAAVIWIFFLIRELRGREWDEAGFVGTVGAVIALGATMIASLLIQLVLSGIVGSHFVHNYDSDLLNIRDGSGISGSFFLGSGVVDSKPVFQFYKKNADGTASLIQEDADNCVVIQGDVDPHVEYMREVSNNNFWVADWLTDDYRVKIYVPTGSIVTNYKLGG
jgi:hypothetical protein